MLGDKAIRQAIDEGLIIIDEFNPKQLGPNSYDLRVGDWICRQQGVWASGTVLETPVVLGEKGYGEELWGTPEQVQTGIIDLHPGELILAHTEEFVGCYDRIVGEMASRSSLMRSGIAVCVDAGLGDVGYEGKWTMEVYNHTRRVVQIPVGSRIAQMKFHEVRGSGISYQKKGGIYGGSKDKWSPDDMIPRSSMD